MHIHSTVKTLASVVLGAVAIAFGSAATADPLGVVGIGLTTRAPASGNYGMIVDQTVVLKPTSLPVVMRAFAYYLYVHDAAPETIVLYSSSSSPEAVLSCLALSQQTTGRPAQFYNGSIDGSRPASAPLQLVAYYNELWRHVLDGWGSHVFFIFDASLNAPSQGLSEQSTVDCLKNVAS